MTNNTTNFWICDNCGKRIEKIEDGWVEWLHLSGGNKLFEYKGIRIVHRINCLYDEDMVYKNYKATVSDFNLKHFASPDGLMELLQFISDKNFEDEEELLEIIKRIHIPGYEEARLYFDEAISEGVFEPNGKPSYYSQTDISDVMKYINSHRR